MGTASKVQRVPEYRLDAIIKNCSLNEQVPPVEQGKYNRHTDTDDDISPFGLLSCGRRMLAEGVDSYQRVSCFRLAVHPKRNGLPYDLALIALKAWMKKNHPADGKRLITDREVEYQTKCAFENSYRNFGCEDPAMV